MNQINKSYKEKINGPNLNKSAISKNQSNIKSFVGPAISSKQVSVPRSVAGSVPRNVTGSMPRSVAASKMSYAESN
jgi:hypothetical protein